MIFDTLVKNEIVSAFSKDLEDAGFEEEEVKEFEIELSKLDEESIKGILCTPQELRERNFPKYKEDMESGKTTIPQILDQIANRSKENGYTIGYHVSKISIPKENGEWKIKGTELDDRDEKLMAYYSLDYGNLYRADRGQKLYAIRAMLGDGTSHKRDTSNNWGRATSLPIVHEMDLVQLDEQTEEILRKMKEEREKGAR